MPAFLLPCLLALTGCSSGLTDQFRRGGLPQGATNLADRVTTLWQGAWISALLVGALVWGLIAWSVLRFRRRPEEVDLPPQVRYNLPVELLYTAVPVVVVLVFFYFTVRDTSEILDVSPSAQHQVSVVGKRWSWDFNYLDAQGHPGVYEAGTPAKPPTLYLPQGESVRFLITGRDVIHSFWVPAFLFKMDMIPGRVNQFMVTPEKVGTYAGKCAELCGLDHSRMLFTVRVVPPAEYQKHLADLRAAGQVGALEADLGPDRRLATDVSSGASEERRP